MSDATKIPPDERTALTRRAERPVWGVGVLPPDVELKAEFPAWALARLVSRERYVRLVRWAVGTSTGGVVALAWALARPGVVMAVLGGVCAALAAACWAGVAHANLGGRRELRAGFERWLYARTQTEVLREMVRAFAAARAHAPEMYGGEERLKSLQAVADATTADVLDEVLKRVDRNADRAKLLAELRRDERFVEAALRTGRAELEARQTAVAAELEALRAEIARTEWELSVARDRERRQRREGLLSGAESSIAYPPPGPVPAMPDAVVRASGEAMRAEVERGRTDAERGRVIESPIAGVFLNDTARWAPYGAPIHMTRELLELFDLRPAEVPLLHGAPEDASAKDVSASEPDPEEKH